MTNSKLDGPRIEPATGEPAQKLVIILHGYGADGDDLIDLGRAWAGNLPDAAFVAPDAPEFLPYEAMGGRQWFPLHERDMREYRLGAEAVAPGLHRFLDAELTRLKLDETALAIVGFSQGAMMALQIGLRRQKPPAALLAYSGLLTGPDQVSGIQTASPVLLVHGADDDIVDPHYLATSQGALENAGALVESHMLEGLGHSIDERGMVLGGRFLTKNLGKQAFAA
ncbi:alpha/beta hydrolase [Roseibium algae]|uniref:Dienelactone hydrolase family protein n=1 Tax=Roseibium algae TaxID=3123038 RepID=A0ABU8TQ42_9HYPH